MMKIPTERISFEKEGYTTESGEPLWLELPRSVREGYVYDMIKMNQAMSSETGTADDARRLVVAALQLVQRWNFDDQAGKALPVLKDCKTPEQEAVVVSEIPMDVVNRIVEQATGGRTEVDKSTA
jgi:hypothetical protein